jgi:ribonuclease VapC
VRISVTDAKGQLTELVRRAEAGDEIILTRHGQAIVRFVPVKAVPRPAARRRLLEAARTSGAESELLISTGTVAEALIVAPRRNVLAETAGLIDGLGFEVVTITLASARRIAEAYRRWGKGVHPAGLNLGDCFSYEVAKAHSCRLLFVGDDFSNTDVERVL